ncbi:Dynamin-like protein 4C [Tolypocladium ophioglossoides CBS 100239]|uniref:Dynamin-like protein 4C n=1 Tax=Tolypocladium ophioglossoides (strain CBS 100239) TaxID=1163406 RepID=A0A0L0NKH4_TOLOC|nr:Dynamin-like protein 4C [Tolypocladium ophioglossoides CBS 100239]
MRAEEIQMFAAGLNTPDLQQLKTKHNELLDTIDKLRDNDIGRYVELPQIIVVGDQSSGKSSVLEAISRVRFPSKSTLCTRFATELVLREADEPRMEKKLAEFNKVRTELCELSNIIKEATDYMGIDGGSNSFSRHTLRVKISGPGVPQLTMVDLPGFYDSSGKNQLAEHRSIVSELAAEYMERESSIILAVVSAKSDPVMQQVLEETRRYDERGQRTLGIITKPDRLERGELEEEFLQLLRNNKSSPRFLKHGWHVLCNRGEGEPADFDTRDKTEAELFHSHPWSELPDMNKGIASLREKLSRVLLMHIASKLPHVTMRIEQLIDDRQHSLADLGEPRIKTGDYLRHLEGIASDFTRLTVQAVGGDEKNSAFFGEICPGSELDMAGGRRNLRAHVRSQNRAFVAIMRKCGAKRVIRWRDGKDKEAWVQADIPGELEHLAACYSAKEPVSVSQDELEELIHKWAMASRGTELPGVYSSKMALTLFEDQAEPWEGIATRHVELIVEAAESLVKEILQFITGDDDEMREKVMTSFVAPFFKDRRAGVKLQEVLPRLQKTSFPLALEEVFQERASGRAWRRLQRQVHELDQDPTNVQISAGVKRALQNPLFAQDAINAQQGKVQEWGIERVLDYMTEYYGMTLETFMTNVIILAVENQLMSRIPDIFTMSKIVRLEEDELKRLAGESEDVQATREDIQRDLDKLRTGLELCEQWRMDNKKGSVARPKVNGSGTGKAKMQVNGVEPAWSEGRNSLYYDAE